MIYPMDFAIHSLNLCGQVGGLAINITSGFVNGLSFHEIGVCSYRVWKERNVILSIL